jgi:hypothetical protein
MAKPAQTPAERTASLLAKAIMALPAREQAAVLRGLLSSALGGAGRSTASVARALQPFGEVLEIGGPEAAETAHEQRSSAGPSATALMMVPVRLSRSQHDRLKEWCAEHNFAMAVVVRGLVERFLEEQGRQAS